MNEADVDLLTSDGQGNLTLTQDRNRGGTVTTGQMATGTYMVASNGRTTASTGHGSGSGAVCYVVQQNEAFCIETSSSYPGITFFEPQSGGPFSNASLSGEYLGGSLPQHVSTNFDTVNSQYYDGAGNFDEVYTKSGPGGTQQNLPTSGPYTVDSTGAITVSSNGSAIFHGYVVGPGKFEAITTDNNPRVLFEVKSSAP